VLTPSTVTVGETFSVTFQVQDVADLYLYQFGILFDKTVISHTPALNGEADVTEGGFLATAGTTAFTPGFYDALDPTTPDAAILFTGATLIGGVPDEESGLIPGASGSGVLFTASFTALAAGTTTISAVFDPVLGDGLFNSLFDDLLPYGAIPEGGVFPEPIIFDGSVTVVAPPPTNVPEPSTLLLLSTGLAASVVASRRRKRRGSSLRD
jgi:hypothetical protein